MVFHSFPLSFPFFFKSHCINQKIRRFTFYFLLSTKSIIFPSISKINKFGFKEILFTPAEKNMSKEEKAGVNAISKTIQKNQIVFDALSSSERVPLVACTTMCISLHHHVQSLAEQYGTAHSCTTTCKEAEPRP